jgi:anaerobic magnesium-protoporphyrin IX monomethyl ester cyclase
MTLVLLVQPPIEDFYLTKKRTLPYGLLSIAASLQSAGLTPIFWTAWPQTNPDPWQHRLFLPIWTNFTAGRTSPCSACFTSTATSGTALITSRLKSESFVPFWWEFHPLFTAYHDTAMTMAAAVRHRNPGIPIVMGGHHPTLFPEQVIASPFVDYVLRGEGEDTLPLLCKALKDHTPLSQVPGIAFQTPKQQIICPPHWTADLSRLPLPDTNQSGYYRRKHQDALVIVSSRGCPMPCSYCSVSAGSGHGRFRKRPVSHVIREIPEPGRQPGDRFH